MSTDVGVQLIQQERQRQIEAEGWTPEHESEHGRFELTRAAMCYAQQASMMGLCVWQDRIPNAWPETWSKEWWKPEPKPVKGPSPMIERPDAIRMLVKAGALIAAEIDRLNRSEVEITAESHPAIFKAFREIDYDSGAVNRLEPERTSYSIPVYSARSLPECEKALAALNDAQLAIFCSEDDDDRNEILAAIPELKEAHTLLNAYFNGWVIEVY